MKTIKTIYLTIIHAALFAMLFFYTSDNYSIVKIQHSKQQASVGCCNGDELTAYLDSIEQKKKR